MTPDAVNTLFLFIEYDELTLRSVLTDIPIGDVTGWPEKNVRHFFEIVKCSAGSQAVRTGRRKTCKGVTGKYKIGTAQMACDKRKSASLGLRTEFAR